MIDSKTRLMLVGGVVATGLSAATSYLLRVVYTDRPTGPTPGPLGQLATDAEPAARWVPFLLLTIAITLLIVSGVRIVLNRQREDV
ncbi:MULTISPECIES: hypothetical protein [Streptomyces]|uniref:Transmembrane protein n=1 Tax=Streptomyces sindenensis TaxID=67363 RepID=A0ABW6EW56_9ACTN